MTPCVGCLESKPITEAPVHPNLQRMVVRGTGRDLHVNRPNIRQYAISVEYGFRVSADSRSLNHRCTSAGFNVIERNVSAPYVETVITNVGNLRHGVLKNFARQSYVPLPT